MSFMFNKVRLNSSLFFSLNSFAKKNFNIFLNFFTIIAPTKE
jgi:hypothetical protein